jgi:hypothetical protein
VLGALDGLERLGDTDRHDRASGPSQAANEQPDGSDVSYAESRVSNACPAERLCLAVFNRLLTGGLAAFCL